MKTRLLCLSKGLLVVFLILTFIAVVSLLNSAQDSANFDEKAHIPAGYSYVTFHDMRLNPEHPPLLKDFSGLMLLPMDLKFDITKKFWTTDINGQWDAGDNLLWREGNNANRIIFWARFPFVLLSLILGWFIFKWTRELAGLWAGLFALLLYAFDPNILGHNHFVTTDLGIAAFMTFSFYYFLRFIKEPTWKNVIIGGIFLGLMQLAKFSSIIVFPIFGLVLLIYPLTKIDRHKNETSWKFRFKNLGEYLGKGIIAFILSFIIVWAVYLPNIYKMPAQNLSDTIEFYFPINDPSPSAVAVNKTANILNKNLATRPLAEYLLGMAMVFKRVDGGNGAYFIGQVSSSAFWAYFPTVFILKEPLQNLFFILLALTIAFSILIKSVYQKFFQKISPNQNLISFIRHNIVSLSLLSFIFLYAFVSITGNLNIGFRHLFPILPFIYILTAKTIFNFLKKLEKNTRLIWKVILVFMSLALVLETLGAYPYYMSYFNQLAGGPKNGYRYVTDSNADWGQDLKRLKIFVDRYNWCPENSLDSFCEIYNPQLPPMDKIRLNYFGGVDIKYYFKNQAIDWWDSRRPIESGWYAISTNYLMGSIYDTTKKDSESYRWTKDLKPFAQVGTAIFLYYVTPQQAEKINSQI